jgi:Alginate export
MSSAAAHSRATRAVSWWRCGKAINLTSALLLAVSVLRSGASRADDSPAEDSPDRPVIKFNRWQEDWSVLANPAVPREPLDELKYIPLSARDPKTYLSLGADARERFESNDAASFGVGANKNADYVISRVEVHADLRIASQFQFFTQLQSDFAPGKEVLTPVDQDRLDLEQAFFTMTESLGGGTLKLRIGRQQFGFDLQRFVSVRDGPNVRQSYDAAWADYEIGKWRLISFYSHPVQDRDLRPFDDYSNSRLTYGGFRVERQVLSSASVALYFSRFKQDDVRFPSISGNEGRDIADAHFAGTEGSFDWDLEGMTQSGQLGGEPIHAWAFGSLQGYTFSQVAWKPRVGLQIDAASGDKSPSDHELNTFNSLFPNGYYVTLAGYTGYVNFIHIKPSLTVSASKRLKLMMALGFQWRETTADAVYTQPDIPVAGTAGRPGRYTGSYGQFRADCALTPHVGLALELVHFAVSDVIREVGGHDGNYAGAEVRFAW